MIRRGFSIRDLAAQTEYEQVPLRVDFSKHRRFGQGFNRISKEKRK